MTTRRYMNKTAIALLTACLMLGSCSGDTQDTAKAWRDIRDSQFVPAEEFLAITNGMEFAEVRAVLGAAVRHQFTVQHDEHTWTLILCFIDTGAEQSHKFYQLLFQDDALRKTIGWIQMEREKYSYQGTTATRQKPWDIDDLRYVEKAIEAPALTANQIRAEIKSARETMRNHKGEGNIPRFVGRLFAPGFRAKAKKDYPINERLRQNFDGCRVAIGMTITEVDELYGKPLRSFDSHSGRTARIYGDDRYLGNAVDASLVFPYVAVLFDDGRVVSVYSDSFFCDQWYPNMPTWRRD